MDDAEEIIRYSRVLNPKLDVLVRCAHLRDVDALEAAGATQVLAAEAEESH